ncbi:5-methyltetrahydropteroyltriglutamate--homocysteine S-methyltransferase, partial [Acidithiobacillus ferrooxidans]|nr:5-methyltetrahydropteroyltriglutamate--homocysteine S-methyltransferase [Acidithiobacillus ferrooxidans]
AAQLRDRHWRIQQTCGMDLVPVGDFSLYDHMLDMSCTLGAIPPRYGFAGGQVGLDTFFAMARGSATQPAMEMTKWFDTNYHFIVPEFHEGMDFRLSSERLFDQVKEVQ